MAPRSGLKVFTTMLEDDRTAVCGPRYAHEPERPASRAGSTRSEVVARTTAQLAPWQSVPLSACSWISRAVSNASIPAPPRALMMLRWVAAGVLEAVKGFRRVKGYADMSMLVAALRARDRQLCLGVAQEERQIA